MDIDIGLLYKYYVTLFLHNNLKSDIMLEDENISIDDIYAYINLFWEYNYGSKLDIKSEESKNTLYRFLDNIFKYRLLLDKTDEAYEDLLLNDKNKFILDNYDYLNEVIDNTYIKLSNFKDAKSATYPPLSKEDLDRYFEEFLLYVDKSGDFLKVYEDMKKNGHVILLDELPQEKQDSLMNALGVKDKLFRNFLWVTESHDFYLVLDRKGDMLDFRTLAHEFTHYLVHYYNNDFYTSDVLREFPSIFYELLANQFLLSKGFSQEDINNATEGRFKDFYDASSMYGITNYYLKMYRECGDITIEEDVNRRKAQISNFVDSIGTAKFKTYLERDKDLNDPEKLADMFSMIACTLLFVSPNSIREGYNYVIGSYLATHFLSKAVKDKDSRDKTFKEMKDLTINLPKLNLDQLFSEVDMSFYNKKKKMSK